MDGWPTHLHLPGLNVPLAAAPTAKNPTFLALGEGSQPPHSLCSHQRALWLSRHATDVLGREKEERPPGPAKGESIRAARICICSVLRLIL